MSVGIPKAAMAFGSVAPPQGDVIEFRIHLGCTKEVSSFECLLQNFGGKYTLTYPINVGDNCHFDIGRGTNVPTILTGRVEEVEPESTPVENYIRVRGRCWGEKIFRRVVTKTYENQKGEAIVKDLLDNYVGLSHVRDTTELVEDTDTTYTLLEYEDTPVFDILKYIAETADKAGVIGFDFRVEWDGKFAFFPRNSKTSPISLAEKIEYSRYSKDIHRVRNKIKVYGAAEKPYPLDTDGQPWSDSLTEDLTGPDGNGYLQHADGQWEPVTGNTTLAIETTEVHTGAKSVKATCTAYMYYMAILFRFDSGKYVNCNKYPKLCFTLQEDNNHNQKVTVSIEDADGNTCRQTVNIAEYDEWQTYELPVGKAHEESWTMSVFNSGDFDWENLKIVRFDFHQNTSAYGSAYVDRMHFGGCRWSALEENWTDPAEIRELPETDEELHSDHECSLRAKALLDYLSEAAESLTVRTTCLDYGNDHLLPADKTPITIPNDNIDADFRINWVEYLVLAREQTLEITLDLGKEKPLLADYLYGLRAGAPTVERLARTKAGGR